MPIIFFYIKKKAKSWLKNNVNDIPNSIYNANTLPDIWQFKKRKEKRKNITSALRQLF